MQNRLGNFQILVKSIFQVSTILATHLHLPQSRNFLYILNTHLKTTKIVSKYINLLV